MDDLDVEAVDDLGIDDAPEYVLYGGKGGVGKTTMAAATALASAMDGVATLVVSTDPAHSLSDALEVDVAADPELVHDEYPLYGVEIDPDAAMEGSTLFDENAELGGLGDLAGALSPDGAEDGPSMGSMPGADEAAAMQQLLRYLDDERFERVVVDTAPTGHTLRLLELPDAMDSLVGRVLSLRERMGDVMSGLSGMFGDGVENGNAEGELDDLRTLRVRVERLRSALRDPHRTDFRIVTVPEELSVIEANRLEERLDSFGIPVRTVVVNRVMEPLADVADVDADVVEPDLADCPFCQRRWDVQQNALAEAQRLFQGHQVERVPLFADEIRGESRLRIVAACLTN